jgi:hypothetical protein
MPLRLVQPHPCDCHRCCFDSNQRQLHPDDMDHILAAADVADVAAAGMGWQRVVAAGNAEVVAVVDEMAVAVLDVQGNGRMGEVAVHTNFAIAVVVVVVNMTVVVEEEVLVGMVVVVPHSCLGMPLHSTHLVVVVEEMVADRVVIGV